MRYKHTPHSLLKRPLLTMLEY